MYFPPYLLIGLFMDSKLIIALLPPVAFQTVLAFIEVVVLFSGGVDFSVCLFALFFSHCHYP